MAQVEQLLKLTESQIYYLLLLFLRVTGLFVLSPVLGRKSVPAMVKIGLSILISYIFLMAYPAQNALPAEAGTLVGYILLCIKELLIGLVLGYMTTLFFSVAMMAGQIMDVQIGFGMAQMYDPEMQMQTSLVGSFLDFGLLLYFLVMNGHHALIRIMYNTFQVIPVGQIVFPKEIYLLVLNAFAIAVSMAVSVALPIIAAELILEIIMGVMIRSVPQLNVFVVGISVKILVGLFALVLLIPFYASYGDKIFDALFTWVDTILKGMIPAT
jgi:flagellar biosynthesis protein FliR